MPPPRYPTVIGESGLPFGAIFEMPPPNEAPDRGLRTHQEVIVRPHVALAINGDATQRVQPAAGIDQRQGPRTRREAEVRDEGHRAPSFSGGDGIERIQQREETLRLLYEVSF